MSKQQEKLAYKVLTPFMHENKKVTPAKPVYLNPRQAANLLAGGFIANPAAKTEIKTAK